MSNKFEQILSEAELLDIYRSFEESGEDFHRIQLMRAAVGAAMAKLAEQEPVAKVSKETFSSDGTSDIITNNLPIGTPLYAHPMPCVSTTSDKKACVSEKAENETQENAPFTPRTPADMRTFIGNHFKILQYFNQETEEPDENDRYTLTIHDLIPAFWWNGHFDYENFPIIREKSSKLNHVHESLVSTFAIKNGFKPKADGSVDERLYSFTNEIVGHVVGMLDSLVKTDHIPDTGKMVADMYWINPDYPSLTSVLDAFEPITSSVEVSVGDRYEVSRARTLPTITVEVTELEENGDVKAYRIVEGDHIPDAKKMIWCQCGDGYPEDSYQAGFIEGRGFCENCNAGEQTNDLKTSESRIFYAVTNYGDKRIMAARGTATKEDVEKAYKDLKLRIAAELMITQENASEVPDGCALVPVEPNEDIYKKIRETNDIYEDDFYRLYADTLKAAAPKFGENENGN